METIVNILNEVKPGLDLSSETELVDSGILDSMAIIQLVARLSDEFDVEITPVDLVPENFNSVQAIEAMIRRLED